jgi:hypothetical protein
MSTKNLARTIIEGGRNKGNKWDRRNSHAENRAAVRNYMSEVRLDPDNYDEYDVEPTEHVRKEFDDKLGPIYRWLNRQVGRPWDEVRADVAKHFDTRTTAGRHIVYDHMLSSVEITPRPPYRWSAVPDDPTTSYSQNDFYVDDDGVLRKKRYLGRRSYYPKAPAWDTKQLANWLGGRVVGKVGGKLFWFVPVTKSKKHKGLYHQHIWRTQWGPPKDRLYYYYGSHGLRWEYQTEEIIYKKDSVGNQILEDGRPIEIGREKVWKTGRVPFFRQGRRLDKEEVAYWESVPSYYQTKVLEHSPNYPEDLKPKQDPYRYYY